MTCYRVFGGFYVLSFCLCTEFVVVYLVVLLLLAIFRNFLFFVCLDFCVFEFEFKECLHFFYSKIPVIFHLIFQLSLWFQTHF